MPWLLRETRLDGLQKRIPDEPCIRQVSPTSKEQVRLEQLDQKNKCPLQETNEMALYQSARAFVLGRSKNWANQILRLREHSDQGSYPARSPHSCPDLNQTSGIHQAY